MNDSHSTTDSRLDTTLLPAGERHFVRRIFLALVVLLVFAGAFASLQRFYSGKFFRVTGDAEWIWTSVSNVGDPRGVARPHRMASGDPVVFFAVRDFTLPEAPQAARIKAYGDPEYALYLNGQRIGGRRTASTGRLEDHLDVYDVSKNARAGRNRVVAAIRSPKGVGGFLFSFDISGSRQNFMVSDESWKLFSSWSPQLLQADPPVPPARPLIIGRPPLGRWNFLPPVKVRPQTGPEAPLTSPSRIVAARSMAPFTTARPEIKTLSGVAVVVRIPVTGRAFDFGPIHGQGRLTFKADESRLVRVRYVNSLSELADIEGSIESFVVARGERTLVDPEPRDFRYMAVFAADVDAEVLVTAP